MYIGIHLKYLFNLPAFIQKWNVLVKSSIRKYYNWFVFCVIASGNLGIILPEYIN